ncbi:MAG: glycosyltransferase family 2 protein [Lachnospiraceae bacterium]
MVTIVIPNYNGYKFLAPCLDAVARQEYGAMKVLVVDDGSTDESVSYLQTRQDVTTIYLKENTGFCGAVNTGIKAADTKYVILLNNDTEVLGGYVQALVERMEQDERIFSASAKMLLMHDRARIDDAGDHYCALGYAFARGKNKLASLYEKPCDVFAACGGASIYRKTILDKIGLFDENHFAYLEDIDIGYRARIYGYTNVYEPAAEVLHFGSGFSGSRYNEFKVSLASRNSVYLIWKNMPLLQIVLNAPFLLVGFLIKWLFFCKKKLGGIYASGVLKGIRMCVEPRNKKNKVRFMWKQVDNYFMVQCELWINIVKYFL